MIKKWKVVSREEVSPSKWFPLFKDKVELPNGKTVEDYYWSQLGDVVMIIGVTKDEKILLVKQYKHGVKEIMIEFPAGRIKKDQSPEQAAIAELREETGYKAVELKLMGKLRTVPSKDDVTVYVYLAKGLQDKGEQEFDENEEIEVIEKDWDGVEKMILEGEINGSDTVGAWMLARKFV